MVNIQSKSRGFHLSRVTAKKFDSQASSPSVRLRTYSDNSGDNRLREDIEDWRKMITVSFEKLKVKKRSDFVNKSSTSLTLSLAVLSSLVDPVSLQTH